MDVTTAFTNIYNAINSNVTDPHDPVRTKWIFSAFPDVYAKDFPDFPIIIINPVSQKDNIIELKNSIKKKQFVCEISVYSKSASQADSIIKDVVSACENVTGLSQNAIERVDYSIADFGGSRLHVRTVISRWISYD